MKRNMQDKVYCPYCKEDRRYTIWSGYVHAVIEGKHIGYFERTALCETCGREVPVNWIADENIKSREEAYAGAKV